MSDIKDLIKKRASIKGRLTIFVNFIDTLKGEISPTQNTELELRIGKIHQLLDLFDEIQTNIEFIVDASENSEQFSERAEFENKCYAILARAKQILKNNESNGYDEGDEVHSCVSGEAPSQMRLTKTSSKSVRLPTIQVPKFSGQYQDWLEFRDTFSSLIHDNKNIGDIQKFHYLRASLEGGAAQVIRSLVFSSCNYKIAWDLVCDRYNNENLLIQNHIQSLFAAEQIKRESATAIRNIIDTFSKNLRSLESLGQPTSHWDTLIIYLINSKLDSKTCREWEEHKTLLNKIKLTDLITFLRNRADLLETLHMHTTTDKQKQIFDHVKGYFSTNQNIYIPKCPLCKNAHRIYKCDKFLNQSVIERAESVRRLRLCTNCLRSGHQARNCISSSCTKCSHRHNTLLHEEGQSQKQDVESPVDRATTYSAHITEPVLLSTAVLHMFGNDNQCHEVRAVLDSGSQASFMTEQLLNKLKLNYIQTQTSVVGINNTVTQITKRCNTFIHSKVNSYKVSLSFLVLPNISNLCSNKAGIQDLRISSQIILADPDYYSPSNVDLLLGADIFWDLLESNQIRLGQNCPILQATKLGYIVSGPTSGLKSKCSKQTAITLCNFTQNDNELAIQEQLAKFWTIEEIHDVSKPVYSLEENLCEQHFIDNFKRMPDGRFSVAIPLKESETRLGNSFDRAFKCFLALERKLQLQPILKQMYTDFMHEYKILGHMTFISNKASSIANESYFLPHHGVIRESSETTKLRAVFNASAATSTGVSLNDLQMVGPTIQNDLFSILIRFRHFSYVMTGDIEKMYRQVLIHDTQRHLQNIIWRDAPNKDLEIYQLNTVTYGTASAPFLAIRCLKQLAIECKDSLISNIISNDFYVDDLVTGAQSASQLFQIKDKVCQELSTGCFNLRKIKTNIPNFEHNDNTCVTLNLGQQNITTILGLSWGPQSDMLCFIQKPSQCSNPSKRSVLSTIGQIFDPLGLLTVFVVQAKIILQKLWLHKVSWDEPLPTEIAHAWSKFTSDLHHLNDLYIPRCVTVQDPILIEIHTFCDASQDAYGACVFVRSITKDNRIQTRLLCAKSKVAPLKVVTIPRLELCGAVIAARLTKKVLNAFRLPVNKCILWTDSSVVLGWLKSSPLKLKMFVKNRISEIQELTHDFEWRHVPTQCNPADLLTRGINMSLIQTLDLWWTGPSFLRESESHWPKGNINSNNVDLPEVVSHIVSSHDSSYEQLIDVSRFSKLLKLKRSMAFVFRFLHNCKKHNTKQKLTGSLTKNELDKAFQYLLRQTQIESFEEYKILQHGNKLPDKNHLLQLSPFIDDFGLIRVGGRLQNSQFKFDRKHPVLLSCKHHIAKLIFTNEHIQLFHAAPQLLLSSVRQQFWPLGGRNMARQVVHNCYRCIRMKSRAINPIMGQLPEQRLSPGYPFQNTGVDYAGPILAADKRGRGCKLIKVYIAVFVCFATKAIHLELVTELTKDAYIAALRRFIARRSKPSAIFSDNGTQFVGAKNEINAFLKHNKSALSEVMANEGIEFSFIPAYAPHFGGLWEAGVKSTKHHLFRVLGNARLTFEELYTTLVQIEAILNSRPLSPISPDPDDLTPLTPGHFLVGRPLTALPSPSLVDANPNRLQRWERTEQLRQHFWVRWQKEYVSELQQKTKWKSLKFKDLQEGTLVLIKQDGLPPMKWSLGRVQKVYSGSDGVHRVADIRTSSGIIRRAFNRICPLPIEDRNC